MLIKRIAIFIVASFWVWTVPLSAQVIPLDPALMDHLSEAMENNPDLSAWADRVQAAAEKVPQAGAWQDPMLTLSIANLPTDSWEFDREAMTAAWIKVGQKIPLGGKFSARKRMAQYQFQATRENEADRTYTIAREVIQTWFDWAYLRQAVRTLDANIALLDQLIVAARRKYETGRGLQQDILRAETERTRLEDRRAALKQAALTTGRRFAVLLGRDPGDFPDPPAQLPDAFPPLDRERLLGQLLERNPALEALRARIEASRQQLSFARRNWVPDLNLGAGYGFRQDSPAGMERADFFTISAGMTIPIFGAGKQGPAVEEAKAGLRETAQQLRAAELNLRLALEKLLDEDSRLDEQIRLYRRGVIPQAQATLDAATAEYVVGKVDFEALLLAETALYNAQLDAWARVRDRLKRRAELAALVADATIIANPRDER